MTEAIRIECQSCGAERRNHQVIFKHHHSWRSDCGWHSGQGRYYVCKCMGCDQVCFYQETQIDGEKCEFSCEQIVRTNVFPDPSPPRFKPIESKDIPERIRKIYLEVVSSLNHSNYLLAGAGLRATIEAICLENNTPGRNLKEKIAALVLQGVLTKQQASFLDECRFIGNEALHEIEVANYMDVDFGLSIVEIILKTLYLLPAIAEPMRERRDWRRGVVPKSRANVNHDPA